MSECTCHKNYTLDTLIPKVGVITDIREETKPLLLLLVQSKSTHFHAGNSKFQRTLPEAGK